MASASTGSVNNHQEDDERSYLLRWRKVRSRYRFRWLVTSKGAVLVLVTICLVHIFDPVVVVAAGARFSDLVSDTDDRVLYKIYSGLSLLFYLLYPFTGLYADIKYGRYKVGLASLGVSLSTCLLMTIGTVLYRLNILVKTGLTVFFAGFVLGNFALTSFMIVMLSFGVDQLLGASGEELSAFMQWFYFSFTTGWAVSELLTCIVVNVHNSIFALYAAHFCSLFVAFLVMVYGRKVMTAEPQTRTNPISQVVRILKYAKSNKFPRRRSALTYWENDYPSRIDLCKEKYGGPFTEEQVQDVKTLFKVIPLLICMLVFFVMADGYHFLPEHINVQYAYCLIASAYFINSFVMIITIAFHQTVLYPLLHKCYPSMLQKIGIGIFLCLLAQISWMVIDLTVPSEVDLCVLNKNSTTNHWEVSVVWMIVPKVIAGLGMGTAAPTTLEFAFAQAPYSMRGVIVGIWFMTRGCMKVVGSSIVYPLQLLKPVKNLRCEFYLFLTEALIVAISLICFVVLSYYYKLRFRGERFDQHQTVEKHFDKYLEQSKDSDTEKDYSIAVDYVT